MECVQCFIVSWDKGGQSVKLKYCHASWVSWRIINGFWIGWLDLLALLRQLHIIEITYNSPQSVTASGSFRFLLDYERLPFHCGWLIDSWGWLIQSLTHWTALNDVCLSDECPEESPPNLSLPRMQESTPFYNWQTAGVEVAMWNISSVFCYSVCFHGNASLNTRCHGYRCLRAVA
jgi:hypothetical protein